MASVVITPRGTPPTRYEGGSIYYFNVTWTGGSTGFDAADISYTGVSFSRLAGSIIILRTNSGNGRATITIRANAVSEGNAEYVYGFDFGSAPPPPTPMSAITLSFSDAEGQTGGTTTLNIASDVDIAGLSIADFRVTNGALSNLVRASARSYSATLAFPQTGQGTTTVELPANSVTPANRVVQASIPYITPPPPPSTDPPEFVPVAKQRILVNVDYRLPIRVKNNPDWVRVQGLYEKDFSYDFKRDEGVVYIVGHPTREVSNLIWELTAGNTHGEADPLEVEYSVVIPKPTITDIGRIKLWRGVEINVHIPIDSFSSATVDGLLVGMGHRNTDATANIFGEIPQNAEFTTTEGAFLVLAKSSGGEDNREFQFDLESGSPPPMNQIKRTQSGAGSRFFWDAVDNATSYAYQEQVGGPWTDVGNVTTHIIDNLGLGTPVRWRVNSPWISDAVLSFISGAFSRVGDLTNYGLSTGVTIRSLAFNSNDNIMYALSRQQVSSFFQHKIDTVNLATGAFTELVTVTPQRWRESITYDSTNNKLYVVDHHTSNSKFMLLGSINLSSGAVTFETTKQIRWRGGQPPGYPPIIHFSPEDNKIYYRNASSNSIFFNKIGVYNPVTDIVEGDINLKTKVSIGDQYGGGLFVDSENIYFVTGDDFFVADRSETNPKPRIIGSQNALTFLDDNLTQTYRVVGTTFDATTKEIYILSVGDNKCRIDAVHIETEAFRTVLDNISNNLRGLALDPNTNTFYCKRGTVLATIDITNGNTTYIRTGGEEPFTGENEGELLFDSVNNNLYFVGFYFYRVDTSTGRITRLGTRISDAGNIHAGIDSAAGRIYYHSTTGLGVIDISDGSRTAITATGSHLSVRMAFNPTDKKMYGVNPANGALVRIDITDVSWEYVGGFVPGFRTEEMARTMTYDPKNNKYYIIGREQEALYTGVI